MADSVSASDMQWLVAPDVFPRVPYFLAIAVAATATRVLLRSGRIGAR